MSKIFKIFIPIIAFAIAAVSTIIVVFKEDSTYELDYTLFEDVVAYEDEVDLSQIKIIEKKREEIVKEIPVDGSMVKSIDPTTSVGENKSLIISYAKNDFSLTFSVKYKIEFMVDEESISTQYVLDASEIVKPEDPKKTGYEFIDWNPSVPSVINDNLVIEAQFTDIPTDIPNLGVLEAEYGDTLAKFNLPSNSQGAWEFVDDSATTVGEIGRNTFVVQFVPTNSELTILKSEIIINVSKKKVKFLNVQSTISYDGLAHKPAYELDAEVPAESIIYMGDEGTKVGDYRYVYKIVDTHYEGSAMGSYKIVPSYVTIDVISPDAIVFGDSIPEINYTVTGLEDFSILGISIDYPTVNRAGNYTIGVEFNCDEEILENFNIVVNEAILIVLKSNLDISDPELSEDTPAIYSNKLSSIEIINNDPNGYWEWVNPNITFNQAGKCSYEIKFIPYSSNFNEIIKIIELDVAKKQLEIVILENKFTYSPTQSYSIIYRIDGVAEGDETPQVAGNIIRQLAGNETVTLTIMDNNYSGKKMTTLIISKYKHEIDFSMEYDVIVDNKLSALNDQLPTGYTWYDENTVLDVAGDFKYQAVWTPDDTDNYEIVTGEILVHVNKKQSSIIFNEWNEVIDGEIVEYYSNGKYTFDYRSEGYTLNNIDTIPGKEILTNEEKNIQFIYKMNNQEYSMLRNAGTYNVIIILPETSKYVSCMVEKIVVINQIIDTKPGVYDAVYGSTLGTITLPNSSYGKWVWVEGDDTLVGDYGTQVHQAMFESSDLNYSSYITDVTINVSKKTLYLKPINNTFIYNGEAHSVEYIITDSEESNDAIENINVVINSDVLENGERIEADQYTFTYEINELNYQGENTFKLIIDKAKTENILWPEIKVDYGTEAFDYISLDSHFKFNENYLFDEIGIFTDKYILVYTPDDTKNYEIETNFINVEVIRLDAIIEVNNAVESVIDYTYGQKYEIDTTINHEQAQIVYEYYLDGELVEEITNAGTYTIVISLPQTEHYNAVSKTITLVVAPMEVEVVWVYNESGYVYDPEGQTYITAYYNDLNNNSIEMIPFEKNGKEFKNVGEYIFEVSASDSNYKLVNPTLTVEITPAPVSKLDEIDAVYGDNLNDISLPVSKLGEWKFVDELTTKVGNYGKNTFAVEFISSSNNYQSFTDFVTINVLKKELVFINVENEYTYDGEAKSIKYEFDGIVDELSIEDIVVKYYVGATMYDSISATNHLDSISDVSLYIENNNYYGYLQTSLIINKANPKVENKLTSSSTNYTGDIIDLSSYFVVVEGENSLQINTYLNSAKHDMLEVGEYVVILTINESDNYNAYSIEIPYSITKTSANLYYDGVKEFTYNGSAFVLDVKSNNNDADARITYMYKIYNALTDGYDVINEIRKAGTYIVYASINETANYEADSIEIKDIIVEKGSISIGTLDAINATYGDTLEEFVIVPDELGSWSWKENLQTPVGNAGENYHIAIYTPNDQSFAEVEQTVKFNVMPKNIEFDVSNTIFDYDGQLKEVTYSLIDAPDTVSVVKEGTLAATDYKEGGYSFTLTVTGDNNYCGSYNGILVINQIDPTYTIPVLNATYNDKYSSIDLTTIEITGTEGSWSFAENVNLDATVGNAGVKNIDIVFTPKSTNYKIKIVTTTLTVVTSDYTPVIPTNLTAVYGQALSSITLESDEGVWGWNNPNTIIDSIGELSYKATFIHNDKNYNAYECDLIINVSKAETKLINTNIPKLVYDSNSFDYKEWFEFNHSEGTRTYTITYNNSVVEEICNAGYYSIVISVTNCTNYTDYTSEEIIVSVAKNTPNISFTKTYSVEWNDKLTLADIQLDLGYTWVDSSIALDNIETKEYDVVYTYTGEEAQNYNPVEGKISVTVNKTSATISANATYTLEYDGSAKTLDNVIASHNESSVIYKVDNEVVELINAGTYNVVIVLPESTHYNEAKCSAYVKINKAKLSLEKTTYDAVYTNTLSDVVELPSVIYGTWHFVTGGSTEVGTVGVQSHNVKFVPNDDYSTNYQEVTIILTINVAQLPTNVTANIPTNLVYNNTVYDPTGWFELSHNQGELVITTKANGVKTSICDALVYTIEVVYNGNDNVASYSQEFSVTVGQATYIPTSIPTASGYYGDVLSDVSLNGGDTAGTWKWVSDTDSITKIPSQSFTATFTPSNTNYGESQHIINVAVSKRVVEFNITANKYTYNGANQAINYELLNVVGTDNPTVSDNTSYVNAGTYTITLKIGDDNQYYTGSITTTLTIEKATAALSLPSINTTADRYDEVNIDDQLSASYTLASNQKVNVAGTFTYDTSKVKFADESSSDIASFNISVKFTPTEEYTNNYNIVEGTFTITLKAVAVSNNVYYGTVESALNSVTSGEVKLIVGTNPIIKTTCTVYSDVKLYIPYDMKVASSGSAKTTATYYIDSTKDSAGNYTYTLASPNGTGSSKGTYDAGDFATTDSTRLKNTLTISNGATLINNGTIEIAGQLSGGSGGCKAAGHTYGYYTRIVLEENTKIESYGTIYCYGYIDESSNVDGKGNGSMVSIESGSIYMPFILRDFRGGSYMKAVYDQRADMESVPFNQFEFRNVNPLLKIKYEGKLYGWANLYAGGQHNATTISFIGNSSSFFIQMTNTKGYVDLKYNVANEINKLDIYGGALTNSLKLSLTILFTSVKMDTTEYYFPWSWRYNVTLNKLEGQTENAIYSMPQKYKILPGCTFTVSKGAELTIGSLVVYDKWTDTVSGLTPYGSGKTLAGGILCVNGKLTANNLAGTVTAGVDKAQLIVKNSASFSTYESTGAVSGSSYSSSINFETLSHVLKGKVYSNGTTTTSAEQMSVGSYVAKNNGWRLSNFSITYENIADSSLDLGTITNPNPTSFNESSVISLDIPTSSNAAVEFIGWYLDEACTNSISIITGSQILDDIKLYAKWEEMTVQKYSVIYTYYNGDGLLKNATSLTTVVRLEENTSLKTTDLISLPVEKAGYTFNYWTYNGSKVETDIVITSDITLIASYTINTYTVTFDTQGGSSVDSQTVSYYSTATKPSNPTRSGYTFNNWYSDASETNVFDFATVITSDTTIYATWTRTCLVEGTLITMADGSIKKVEDINAGDYVLVFNHYTGKYESSVVMYNVHKNDPADYYNIINLVFSDGTTLRIHKEHYLFDMGSLKYELINEENVSHYINHNFYWASYDGNNYNSKEVTLVDYYITSEYIKVYGPITAVHLNLFANGLLNVAGDNDPFLNIFEINENLMYDQEQMQKDIEEYGLFTYDDFKDYITEDIYYAYQGQYLKVAISKGYTTFERILELIDKYLKEYTYES